MLMGEKSEQMQVEGTKWCPKCGASLEQTAEAMPQAAPGNPTCELCGAPVAPLETNYSPDPAAVPPIQPTAPPRGRNPLALLVVALVAAGMLYFGFHMARRSGTNHPLGIGTAGSRFAQTLDSKTVSLSSLRESCSGELQATWCGPCKIQTLARRVANQYGAWGP
jgi:hypothetical protein